MAGTVRIGIGGWSFDPWRETFYPAAVKRADELRHAASVLTAIEINATFYRTQTEATFTHWRAQVPDGFLFAVKAPRAATYVNDIDRAASSVERFLGSGLLALGAALGPILWQFAPTRRFDVVSLGRFLALLPSERDGIALRHAIELRHETARDPALARLLSERGVALALVARPGVPPQVGLTAPFVYARLEETVDEQVRGYDAAGIARWAERLGCLADGRIPDDLAEGTVGDLPERGSRDVFAFVISGAKRRNPAAARALIEALAAPSGPRAGQSSR